MAALKIYTNWNKRSNDTENKIEPFRKYFFICEGQNTEFWYFTKLKDIKKELSISSTIEIEVLEKTDEDKNSSNPKNLINMAEKFKKDKNKFDSKRDKMIIVFDVDIFESQQNNYEEILKLGKNKNKNILGITNPSFELFLLLHYKNSLDEIIIPNKEEIIKNEWTFTTGSKMRFVEKLFREKSNLMPKKDSDIGNLANNVLIAIEQEKNDKINKNVDNCKGLITSNIGSIIESIINDKS